MDKKPEHPGKVLWVVALICAAVAIGLFAVAKWMHPYSGWLLFGILGGFAAIFAGGAVFSQIKLLDEYELAQTDFEAYKKMKEEEAERIQERIRENQRLEEERLSKLPACPVCGRKDTVKRISTMNRSVSVAAAGLASSKIGKQYECTNCKHKW